jgi:hypothetical protein
MNNADDKQDSAPLPDRGPKNRVFPEPPDQNRLPLLPYYERFPHLRPPRKSWRRSIRRRLMESG